MTLAHALDDIRPRLLRREAAAAYLGISPRQIVAMIATGDLAVVPIGRRRLIDREELDRYIDAARRRAE